MHSAPVMNSDSGRKLKGIVRRWTSSEPDKLEDADVALVASPEALQELAERTVPIKPDHPDDDKPPYTKEEALAIKAGKQSVHRAEGKAGLFKKLRRTRLMFDDGGALQEEADEQEEGWGTPAPAAPQQMSDENLTPYASLSATAAKQWHDDRPPSRESAAVTSESGEDEAEATGKHDAQALLLPPPNVPTDPVEKHRRRPSVLATFIHRHSFFRRSSSKSVASLGKALEEESIDPRSKTSVGTREPPDSPSTASSSDHHHNHHHHHHHHQRQPHPSRLAFFNPFTSYDHVRRAREEVSAEEWCALIARKYPLLFTNNDNICAYLDIPGPSDKLVRLIDDTPFTDPVDAEGRECVRNGLNGFYNVWLEGALRDFGMSKGWRLDTDWGFMMVGEAHAPPVSVTKEVKEKERERVDSSAVAEAKRGKKLSRMGSMFSRKKSGLPAEEAGSKEEVVC